MVSQLAKSQIEKFKSEGLSPTFEDIVNLNNLGLRVENGPEMFSFSACPRLAFLNETILREPSIAKRIWIDYAQALFQDNAENKIFVLAYALGTADNELPNIHKKNEIEKAVIKFRDDVLLKCTDTQILAAIQWCLNGVKPDLELPEFQEEKEEIDEVFKIPENTHSIAKQLINQAYSYKINFDKDYTMLEDLEKLIMIAAMNEGTEISKNDQMKWSGKFYVAAGKIHERLKKEKENGEI